MKLQCQVAVINTQHVDLSVNTSGKYLKSTLAIGKDPKSEIEYFIILFSSLNKTGKKYRVKSIKRVFVKCINEGKATIRFGEPPHDLCIKSEVIQLKCFMKLVRLCLTNNTKELQLSNLSNLSVVTKDVAPTKLIVHDRSELPIKGFPRTLKSLYLKGLKLCNFRRDILSLQNLTLLDLSDNEIEKLPPEFGRMPNLSVLNLASNKLGAKDPIDWRWLFGPQLTKFLKVLDLSGNQLKSLPKAIWKLQNLVELKIDNNSIMRLPATIGRISSLRVLSISHNLLQTLPCGLLQCRLDSIDLSYNRFYNTRNTRSCMLPSTPWNFYIGSLKHIASKVVLSNKIMYGPNIIPWTLVEFLDNAKICLCGAPVLNDEFRLVLFGLQNLFRSITFTDNLGAGVQFECYHCSFKCYNKKHIY